MDRIKELMKLIRESDDIVFFGGAGVSTASGIPDFRGANGIFRVRPEEIVSHSYFLSHPDEFYDFYWKYMVFPSAVPNPCHIFLKMLEEDGKNLTVITQNIDGLHQKAGSKNVIELHGSTHHYHCMRCNKKFFLSDIKREGVPRCSDCGSMIRPDVILYEEPLDQSVLEKAIEAIANASLMIVGGTSLRVYPAAGLIKYFRGKNIVQINIGTTFLSSRATICIDKNIVEVMNIENYLQKNHKC